MDTTRILVPIHKGRKSREAQYIFDCVGSKGSMSLKLAWNFCFLEMITEDEKALGPSEAQDEANHFPAASYAAENPPAPPCPSSESLSSKDTAESPARKTPKNRVKLAANFSLAPVTKL